MILDNSKAVDAIGLSIIMFILGISIFSIIRSIFIRVADSSYSSHEDYLRAKYRRDGYFGIDHPDHFDYQRKVGKFTYFPNTKKAKQYYKQKRKIKNHQRNYKSYNTQYKKRYKKDVNTNKRINQCQFILLLLKTDMAKVNLWLTKF